VLIPGVIDTSVIYQTIGHAGTKEFSSAEHFKSGPVQKARNAAKLLISIFDEFLKYESGGFAAIKKMS